MRHFLSLRKTFALTLLFIFALTMNAFAYTGNQRTGKFHYDNCRWAHKISDNNRVYFDSRDEAVNAGFVPCKVCHP